MSTPCGIHHAYKPRFAPEEALAMLDLEPYFNPKV